MITKYKQFNESIKSLLVGPSKEEMKDYWKSRGFDRTFDTPEEFLLYVMSDMKSIVDDEYLDSIFWLKNGNVLFEENLENKELYINYDFIWKILRGIFNVEFKDIKELILHVNKEINDIDWNEYVMYCTTTRRSNLWKQILKK